MSDAVASGFASLEASQISAVRRRAILSCAIGNFFELFDFTIYGYFAVAITRAFYPSGSMYGTYAAFGAAFLMRQLARSSSVPMATAWGAARPWWLRSGSWRLRPGRWD
jgi:hypothetical protein